jgi:hypothetical protein
MLAEPECFKRKCRHWLGINSGDGTEAGEYVYCTAFPRGIPYEIAYGTNPHSEVQKGQVGDYIYEKGEG